MMLLNNFLLFENSVWFEESEAAGCAAHGEEEGLLQTGRGHGDHSHRHRMQGPGRRGEKGQKGQEVDQKIAIYSI